MNKTTRADLAIRIAAAVSVVVVAAIAAVISYQHAYDLVVAHGESGAIARALPLTVDGLIVTCSLVLLDAARRCEQAPLLAWLLLGCGIVATLGANVAHGLAHGWVGAVIAGWPALVAVGSFEMLSRLIRGGRAVATDSLSAASERADGGAPGAPESAPVPGGVPAPDVPSAPVPVPEGAPAPGGAPAGVPDGVSVLDRDEEPQDAPAPAAPAAPGVPAGAPGGVPVEVLERAATVFADQLAAGRVPGQRAIKRTLQVGQARARQVQAYLGGLAGCTAH